MAITSKQDLIDYCLRRLGHPVIEINVDEEQLSERVDDAIAYWQEYHFDGSQRTYFRALVTASTLTLSAANANSFSVTEKITGETSGATAEVYKIRDSTTLELKRTDGTFVDGETITGAESGASYSLASTDAFVLGTWDKQYFDIADNIMSVVRVFNIGPSTGNTSPRSIFDVVYQFRLSDMYNLISSDLVYYTQMKQHLSLLDMILPSERTVRFNRRMNRLHMDCNWYEVFTPGTYILAECHAIVDPDVYTEAYNDMFLKRYATALIKRQWGANMSKFEGVRLPGGVTLNGGKIYQEADAEIQKIEDEMRLMYELPANFFVG